MADGAGFLPTPALVLPEGMSREEEVDILEAIWWHLNPGDVGYNQPIWAFCGFTEEQWRERRFERGWR